MEAGDCDRKMKFTIAEDKGDKIFYCSIGISGSGKSTYLHKIFEPEVIVEPDAIRREMTGSVSDQSNDAAVWREAAKRVNNNLQKEPYTAVLDATNTVSRYRKDFLKHLPEGTHTVALVFMPQGTDEEIVDKLYKRIQRDLKNKKDRSEVPKEVIERQLRQFRNGLQNIQSQFDMVEEIPVELTDEDEIKWFNSTSYA
jgi:predicted kinase